MLEAIIDADNSAEYVAENVYSAERDKLYKNATRFYRYKIFAELYLRIRIKIRSIKP